MRRRREDDELVAEPWPHQQVGVGACALDEADVGFVACHRVDHVVGVGDAHAQVAAGMRGLPLRHPFG